MIHNHTPSLSWSGIDDLNLNFETVNYETTKLLHCSCTLVVLPTFRMIGFWSFFLLVSFSAPRPCTFSSSFLGHCSLNTANIHHHIFCGGAVRFSELKGCLFLMKSPFRSAQQQKVTELIHPNAPKQFNRLFCLFVLNCFCIWLILHLTHAAQQSD